MMTTPLSKKCTNAKDALAFVETHGVVLASAKGVVPRLTEAIVGEPIKGSWWSHAEGKRIFAILSSVEESEDVLVCRLIDGKVTLVHRRLWPALVRIADRFSPERLAQVTEEHTSSGRHASHEKPYPQWVPADVVMMAEKLDEQQALAALGDWAATAMQGR